jgi:hypothetical protein
LIILAVALPVFNGVRVSDPFNFKKISNRPAVRLAWGATLVFICYFLVRQFFENLIGTTTQDPLVHATTMLVQNACYTWELFVVVLWGRKLSFPQVLVTLMLAVGIFAGLNLAFDNIIPRTDTEFGESRFEGLSRWLPPMVRGNANFAMLCTVCVGTCMNLLARWKAFGLNGMLKLFVFFSMLMAGIAALRCQFRADLLTLLAAFVMVFINHRIIIRWLMVAAFVCMITFPALFIGNMGYKVMDLLPIDQTLEMLGSKTADSTVLSGRTEIYAYGWQRFIEPKVFFFGEGPVLRDALQGLGDTSGASFSLAASADYRLPYHSTCLDSLMQHGAFIGIFILGLLLFLGMETTKRSAWLDASQSRQPLIPGVVLTLWFTISIMDGGLASFENLVFTIIFGFGALSWRENLLRQHKSVPVPPTSQPRRSFHANVWRPKIPDGRRNVRTH